MHLAVHLIVLALDGASAWHLCGRSMRACSGIALGWDNFFFVTLVRLAEVSYHTQTQISWTDARAECVGD